MKFLNGYKTVISSVIMIVVNSDWMASHVTDPELYGLIQLVAAALFLGSAGHRIKKQLNKKS